MSALGYQQINDVSSAVPLTVPAGARRAVVVALDQAVRWRDDGTSPTATVGIPLAVDTPLVLTEALGAIEFFERVAGAELNISYYS